MMMVRYDDGGVDVGNEWCGAPQEELSALHIKYYDFHESHNGNHVIDVPAHIGSQ
jgi:hypothetical protein